MARSFSCVLDQSVSFISGFTFGNARVGDAARSVTKQAETNTLLLLWVRVNSRCSRTDLSDAELEKDAFFPALIKVIGVAVRGGAAIVVEASLGDPIWKHQLFRSCLAQAQTQAFTCTLCAFGASSRVPIRIHTNLEDCACNM